ncbi:YceI family protein [Jeotgalibacillus salarius]|uniref:Polyisoprenoid-binding protein n=1 Tax=Jeotgalibacillus salarius TaxID=546023 RepID=A0A4Y8LJZ1_9BACL|nr:YceI family protein [Jeotgalibacillus salarius]TFE02059.1 polyisoprenoid-binding protein [Jeotgalibacillus salarius]
MTNSTAKKWAVDTAHSSVDFSVKHMMISKVKGSFHEFSADVAADPQDLTGADISFSIKVNSIDTRSQDRDNHLRSADFFEVETYPEITFRSTDIKKTGEDEYEMTGDVTIKDVTRQETFKVEYEGSGQDPWGNQKVGFTADGKINRKNYGLTWNQTLETGGVLVGEDIKINLQIQAQEA